MTAERFEATPALAQLKDFQRWTVDYVFAQLYGGGAPAGRFLVADEVGLGKTLVARGVIARALEYLQDRVERIDVVYVCSNSAIAGQNVARLKVAGTSEFALASRLTLLPLHVQDLKKNRVNFVSFTPGTSFDLRSRGGIKRERALLYRMLREESRLDERGLLHLLQGTAGWDGWCAAAQRDWPPIDDPMAADFRAAVRQDGDLSRRLQVCAERMSDRRRRIDSALKDERYTLIGQLRQTLARACLDALEPDLVILDEFQRFRDLLDGEDEAAELAQALFNYPGVRTLLLSATPYKMLSLDHEAEDDHYPDFLRTLGFLLGRDGPATHIGEAVQAYRRALLGVDGFGDALGAARLAKQHLEDRLRLVMCRTERIALTRKRDAMLIEPPMPADLRPQDLRQVRLADLVANGGGAPDVVEYWKSSPYLLNFARHYKLREALEKVAADPSASLIEAMDTDAAALLSVADLDRYAPVDPANPRMRALFADTLDRGLWRVLWVPPSMPYWSLRGAFAEVRDTTKALVFSSWNMVPDAIATLCSYEAERRALAGLGDSPTRTDLHVRLRPLLRFAQDGGAGRLTGMPTLVLMLPSPVLAGLIDPLALALGLGTDDGPADVELLLGAAAALIHEALSHVLVRVAPAAGGREDERWYWAAPVLLERPDCPLIAWCRDPNGWGALDAKGDDGDTRFLDHVEQLVQAADGRLDPPLGPPPADLAGVLAELALAGPGNCALRALGRLSPDLPFDHPALLAGAATVAGGFRSLFNAPESIALLRGGNAEAYWRLALRHGLEGNLQALLDEQVHVLQESLGLVGAAADQRIDKVAEALGEALSIRTAQVVVDQVAPTARGGRLEITPFRMRCHFALRFGELKDDSDQTLSRAETVRVAFNSPFRPFVLASTSIGQEGLDFHTWCHAVMHWNLPSNPVDLEQREGRVHRYKGHAVRKNLARAYGLPALRREWGRDWDGRGDPWRRLFELAKRDKAPGTSDLVPYWIFEHPEGAAVERRIPLVAFSRDVAQVKRLKTGLALYRLVFGQPRQEDLLAFLGQVSPETRADLDDLILSLAPSGGSA